MASAVRIQDYQSLDKFKMTEYLSALADELERRKNNEKKNREKWEQR